MYESIKKETKMFSWNGLVAIGLIKELKDPELVRYFMSILKPLRRDMVEEEAREWHQSRPVYRFGAALAYYRLLLRSVRYFRRGFIKCPCFTDKMEEFALHRYYHGNGSPDEMENPQKIKIVNLMLSDTEKSKNFRGGWGISDLQEALEDFILFDNDCEAERSDDEWSSDEEVEEREKPYILVETLEKPEWAWSAGGLTMNIIG